MISPLNEILFLRKDEKISIDYQNSNRYRIVILESGGSKTAYCFSTPIYNLHTRKLVQMKFTSKNENFHYLGSNAEINIENCITLKNSLGYCNFIFPEKKFAMRDNKIICGCSKIQPTLNGVAIETIHTVNNEFILEVSHPFMDIRANDKCFALMAEKFTPFLTVSCIGSINNQAEVIAPAILSYKKLSDTKYILHFASHNHNNARVLFEINLYEQKLFQDTTVESNSPKSTNTFGSISFLGTTKIYGQQWLYSRIDYSKISDLCNERIEKAILHLPKLNSKNIDIASMHLSERFCSFGSTWDNKINAINECLDNTIEQNYINIDVRKAITGSNQRLVMSNGILLKNKDTDSGFVAISTGDCYLYPEILEIKYKS